MKSTKFLNFIFALLAVTVFFSGCKREDNDEDTSSAVDNSLAENSFNDVGSIALQSFDGALGTFKSSDALSGPCATITHDSLAHIITINFGTTNCLCNDGRNRRGSIIVNYTGAYRDPGSSHTITFDNYYVNDNQIAGTKTVMNTGRNQAGNLVFTIVENGSIVKVTGETFTRVSNRVREWIAGELTQTWNDDIYLISGTATGTNATGGTFSSSITTALRKEMGCRNFVSGVVEMIPNGRLTRTIDFGNGTCDNTATVTINGRSRTITLP